MIDVQIPVKYFVNKYLMTRYGPEHIITKKTFLGLLILELLNNKVEKPDFDLKNGCHYTVKIPEFYFKTKGFNVNRSKAKLLGQCLEKLFFEEFYKFVDTELMKGENAYPSVALFLKIYDLKEGDVKLESMYRNFQRHSNEKIKEKKSNI